MTECLHLKLRRSQRQEAWGFRVSKDPANGRLFVHKLSRSSVAENGGLQMEDEVKQVNGFNVHENSCEEIMELIKNSRMEMDLLIERKCSQNSNDFFLKNQLPFLNNKQEQYFGQSQDPTLTHHHSQLQKLRDSFFQNQCLNSSTPSTNARSSFQQIFHSSQPNGYERKNAEEIQQNQIQMNEQVINQGAKIENDQNVYFNRNFESRFPQEILANNQKIQNLSVSQQLPQKPLEESSRDRFNSNLQENCKSQTEQPVSNLAPARSPAPSQQVQQGPHATAQAHLEQTPQQSWRASSIINETQSIEISNNSRSRVENDRQNFSVPQPQNVISSLTPGNEVQKIDNHQIQNQNFLNNFNFGKSSLPPSVPKKPIINKLPNPVSPVQSPFIPVETPNQIEQTIQQQNFLQTQNQCHYSTSPSVQNMPQSIPPSQLNSPFDFGIPNAQNFPSIQTIQNNFDIQQNPSTHSIPMLILQQLQQQQQIHMQQQMYLKELQQQLEYFMKQQQNSLPNISFPNPLFTPNGQTSEKLLTLAQNNFNNGNSFRQYIDPNFISNLPLFHSPYSPFVEQPPRHTLQNQCMQNSINQNPFMQQHQAFYENDTLKLNCQNNVSNPKETNQESKGPNTMPLDENNAKFEQCSVQKPIECEDSNVKDVDSRYYKKDNAILIDKSKTNEINQVTENQKTLSKDSYAVEVDIPIKRVENEINSELVNDFVSKVEKSNKLPTIAKDISFNCYIKSNTSSLSKIESHINNESQNTSLNENFDCLMNNNVKKLGLQEGIEKEVRKINHKNNIDNLNYGNNETNEEIVSKEKTFQTDTSNDTNNDNDSGVVNTSPTFSSFCSSPTLSSSSLSRNVASPALNPSPVLRQQIQNPETSNNIQCDVQQKFAKLTNHPYQPTHKICKKNDQKYPQSDLPSQTPPLPPGPPPPIPPPQPNIIEQLKQLKMHKNINPSVDKIPSIKNKFSNFPSTKEIEEQSKKIRQKMMKRMSISNLEGLLCDKNNAEASNNVNFLAQFKMKNSKRNSNPDISKYVTRNIDASMVEQHPNENINFFYHNSVPKTDHSTNNPKNFVTLRKTNSQYINNGSQNINESNVNDDNEHSNISRNYFGLVTLKKVSKVEKSHNKDESIENNSEAQNLDDMFVNKPIRSRRFSMLECSLEKQSTISPANDKSFMKNKQNNFSQNYMNNTNVCNNNQNYPQYINIPVNKNQNNMNKIPNYNASTLPPLKFPKKHVKNTVPIHKNNKNNNNQNHTNVSHKPIVEKNSYPTQKNIVTNNYNYPSEIVQNSADNTFPNYIDPNNTSDRHFGNFNAFNGNMLNRGYLSGYNNFNMEENSYDNYQNPYSNQNSYSMSIFSNTAKNYKSNPQLVTGNNSFYNGCSDILANKEVNQHSSIPEFNQNGSYLNGGQFVNNYNNQYNHLTDQYFCDHNSNNEANQNFNPSNQGGNQINYYPYNLDNGFMNNTKTYAINNQNSFEGPIKNNYQQILEATYHTQKNGFDHNHYYGNNYDLNMNTF